MKKGKIQKDIEAISRRYKNKKRVVLAISIIILGLLYTFKNTSFLIRSLSAIGLMIFFYTFDHFFDVDFKERHYFFIILIAISSFLFSPLYYLYANYDKIQHLILPIMFASIASHMVSKLKLKRKWKLTFVFFIVIGIIGLHEIGEYLLDVFFDLKLQGVFLRDLQGLQKYDILLDRIDDTMIDMALGTLGAGLYTIYCLVFKKKIN